MSDIRYASQLTVRCLPEVAHGVDKAAAAKLMKPAEYIRRALVDRLQADGVLLPPAAEELSRGQQYALVAPGGNVLATSFRIAADDRGQWLPIENEDMQPFDPAQHWRLKPLALRVDGERVVRTYPVVAKSQEHA